MYNGIKNSFKKFIVNCFKSRNHLYTEISVSKAVLDIFFNLCAMKYSAKCTTFTDLSNSERYNANSNVGVERCLCLQLQHLLPRHIYATVKKASMKPGAFFVFDFQGILLK